MREPSRVSNVMVLIVVFVTTLTSCSRQDPYLTEGVGSDGVREMVSIAPVPLPAPWRLIEDLTIGIDYGEEGEMLRWPRNFIVMDDGTHVVLDDRPLQIRIFDADGVFVRAFGEQGQGPADFLRYIDQRNVLRAVGPDQFELWTGMGTFDQLLVTSSGRLFITTFDQDWIRELDPSTGDELVRFRWDHEPDTYTGARLEERWGPETDRRVADALVWFEERVSLMHISEGPDEEIWVQRTVKNTFRPGQANLIMPDPGNIIPTDVFSSSGAYRGRMELPFEARSQRMFREYLYAISRTDGGAPALIRYRLEAVR